MKKEINILKKEDFTFLHQTLTSWGYRKVSKKDSAKVFNRLALSPPDNRRIVGREASYWYTNHGYTAKIHTTYLEKEGKWRDVGTDAGWVLITEGDQERYFAQPFQRRSDFILKILRYAWITKFKVDHRPLCPTCSAYMDIYRRPETRQYFWICRNSDHHPENKFEFRSWDYGLKEKALEFLKIRRDIRKEYRDQNKKLGKNPTPAPLIRKRWKIGNPQNKK